MCPLYEAAELSRTRNFLGPWEGVQIFTFLKSMLQTMLSDRTLYGDGNDLYLLSNMIATSFMWLQSSWNVTTAVKKQNFLFPFNFLSS